MGKIQQSTRCACLLLALGFLQIALQAQGTYSADEIYEPYRSASQKTTLANADRNHQQAYKKLSSQKHKQKAKQLKASAKHVTLPITKNNTQLLLMMDKYPVAVDQKGQFNFRLRLHNLTKAKWQIRYVQLKLTTRMNGQTLQYRAKLYHDDIKSLPSKYRITRRVKVKSWERLEVLGAYAASGKPRTFTKVSKAERLPEANYTLSMEVVYQSKQNEFYRIAVKDVMRVGEKAAHQKQNGKKISHTDEHVLVSRKVNTAK